METYQLNCLKDLEKKLREHCRAQERAYAELFRPIKYKASFIDWPFNPSLDHSLPTLNFITRKGRYIEIMAGNKSFGMVKIKNGMAKDLYTIAGEAYDSLLNELS